MGCIYFETPCTYIHTHTYIHIPTRSAQTGCYIRAIFKRGLTGLNSEFPSFRLVTITWLKSQSALLFSQIWGENRWIHTFPKIISPRSNCLVQYLNSSCSVHFYIGKYYSWSSVSDCNICPKRNRNLLNFFISNKSYKLKSVSFSNTHTYIYIYIYIYIWLWFKFNTKNVFHQ